MSEQNKITNRIMGDYSIAKSYKGILRIGHIMQLDTAERDILFNPYYYGNPTALMDISGGVYSSKEYGYPNPITGMSGTCNRYTSENPTIEQDQLRLLRVPLTDSMGNYLNWNIGLNGVTIGSGDEINGNKVKYDYFYQNGSNRIIVQEMYFPVVESETLTVGLRNKVPAESKFGINQAQVEIKSSKYGDNALLIIENRFDKTQKNTKPIYKRVLDSDGFFDKAEKSTWKSYNKSARRYNRNQALGDQYDKIEGDEYSKIRTIYHCTKPSNQDYDVFMYRQDDYDVDNFKGNTLLNTEGQYTDHLGENFSPIGQGKLLDCNVDIVNLRDYVKNKIKDYLNGNVIEVPSGTVIWQYCSLDKWYARKVNPSSIKKDDFPGNRPAMNVRAKSDSEKFFSTLIQGACKKTNHLINESKANVTSKEEKPEDTDVSFSDDDSVLDELIPLYKRDYVLCDGSLYRIPYRPTFNNANISTQREAFDRFINLLFAIGYKYTERNNVAARTDFRVDTDGNCILQSKFPTNGESRDIDVNIFDNISPTKSKELYLTVSDTFNPSSWIGNPPNLVDVKTYETIDPWKYLDDYDVLFGMDFASMVACDLIFDEYNSENMFREKSPSGVKCWLDQSGNPIDAQKWLDMDIDVRFGVISRWAKKQLIPEKYIFNTFITDSQQQVNNYYFNTFGKNDKEIKVLSIPYYNFITHGTNFENKTDENGKQILPIIHVGREVNSLDSWIKIYDHNERKYKVCKVWQLPNVQLFMLCLSTKHRIEDSINKFCYMYFNYNFQVPKLMADDKSPVYIGSSGVRWSDPRNRELIKVETWSSNFTSTSMPHRHALFCSPIQGFNTKNAINDFAAGGGEYLSGSACHGGNPTENQTRVDGEGSYIVNEIICEWDETISTQNDITTRTENNQDIFGTRVRVLQIPPIKNSDPQANPNGDVDISFDNIVTGSFRNDVKILSNKEMEKLNYTETEPINWEDVSVSDGNKMEQYYNYEQPYWYSFRLKDDPRFDTGEPNRGITSPPTATYTYEHVPHDKLTINKENFGTGANGNLTGSFFSAENIKMLPLIKI